MLVRALTEARSSFAMKKYNHLTQEERYSIERMRKGGYKQNEIAACLGRSESTISRELRRNRGFPLNIGIVIPFEPGTDHRCDGQERRRNGQPRAYLPAYLVAFHREWPRFGSFLAKPATMPFRQPRPSRRNAEQQGRSNNAS